MKKLMIVLVVLACCSCYRIDQEYSRNWGTFSTFIWEDAAGLNSEIIYSEIKCMPAESVTDSLACIELKKAENWLENYKNEGKKAKIATRKANKIIRKAKCK